MSRVPDLRTESAHVADLTYHHDRESFRGYPVPEREASTFARHVSQSHRARDVLHPVRTRMDGADDASRDCKTSCSIGSDPATVESACACSRSAHVSAPTKSCARSVPAAWARSIGQRDARLRRDVALKVLPSVAAGDPNRRERFTREALAVRCPQSPAHRHHPFRRG
jgi:hypothetical protein